MKNSFPDLYGSLVFNDAAMRSRLPKDIYKALKKTITDGTHLELDVANTVAAAMKEWAVERGATHFTHWFQPMTGITAEKHDSFLSLTETGEAIAEFSGRELIKGEPDASSFPSGGLRATFEARGYTAWDPTSYAFLKGHTLCIPTAFCSYSGEALDKKTPLLRSMEAINREALRLLRILGVTGVRRVLTTVGAEQEYFLIDKQLYLQREDLIFCGRTLMGAPAPKGQEMDDHYFGALRPRVESFMEELNEELWKLGIPAKTEHNEVAPSQHELAPVFETVNVAADHNQLVIELMRKTADRHGLVCLLHEKPFEGINGSGKHNNWSLSTDTGVNLLDPGKTPAENIQFLLFLTAVIRAVDEYADLLRVSVSTAGNDYRLGGSEAPPAIVSMFLGDELEAVVESILSGAGFCCHENRQMSVGAAVIPHFIRDNTDRNRTSPFAFTGNKFEFRMPGASLSLSGPNVVLNTAVAESLAVFSDLLEQVPQKELPDRIRQLLKETLSAHRRILFGGNGYTREWEEEARRRGLPVLASTPEALPAFIREKSIRLFTKHQVFTREEILSRYEIMLENYCKTLEIEARTMADMVGSALLPAVWGWSGFLTASVLKKKELDPALPAPAERKALEKLSVLSEHMDTGLEELREILAQAGRTEDLLSRGILLHDSLLPAMEKVRKAADAAEGLLPADRLPWPPYKKLLFSV